MRRLCRADGPDGVSGSESRWQSAFLYQEVPDESLLCLQLVPRMLKELSRDRIDAFFFIRYWEGGFHWRLRVRSERPRALQEILTAVGSRTTEYRQGQYEQETDRYGGPQCMGICEAHFMLSSSNAYGQLTPHLHLKPPEITRKVRLPRAAADMMILTGLAYPDRQSSVRFLRRFWTRWLAPSSRRQGAEAQSLRSALEQEMSRQFRLLAPELRERLRACWRTAVPDPLLGQMDGSGAPFGCDQRVWTRGSRTVVEALRRAGLEPESDQGHRTLSGLVHMNNNRLGVVNRDEAFLAYICERTLLESAS